LSIKRKCKTIKFAENHLKIRLDMVCADALNKSCKSFVEPQIIPPLHCYQIAKPLKHTAAAERYGDDTWQNYWQTGQSISHIRSYH